MRGEKHLAGGEGWNEVSKLGLGPLYGVGGGIKIVENMKVEDSV